MRRSLRLVLGGIGLLLAASLAVPVLQVERSSLRSASGEAQATIADAGDATLSRLSTSVDRVERARPLVLAVLLAVCALLALRWVRRAEAAPVLVPVRVEAGRRGPARAPPSGPRTPHR